MGTAPATATAWPWPWLIAAAAKGTLQRESERISLLGRRTALCAAKQYSDVAPAAGALLALAATWNAVAAAAAADTWRLNNAVRAEPLYPHKVAGMRSQTRLTIEAFEGL